ncbi:hypothetical protein AB0L00_44340, partial [Actinoallomurus sp. NPDC052308]
LDWRTLQPARPLTDVHATLVDLLRGRIAGPAHEGAPIARDLQELQGSSGKSDLFDRLPE